MTRGITATAAMRAKSFRPMGQRRGSRGRETRNGVTDAAPHGPRKRRGDGSQRDQILPHPSGDINRPNGERLTFRPVRW